MCPRLVFEALPIGIRLLGSGPHVAPQRPGFRRISAAGGGAHEEVIFDGSGITEDAATAGHINVSGNRNG